MKISVVTIAWNDLDGIKRTVDSVRTQDWPDVEHVVIDGGSTDGTIEWLEQFGGSATWVSEPDDGRYDAMNKGAAMSTGDLLWFMHSSDTFHSATSIRHAAEAFEGTDIQWGYGLSAIKDAGRPIGIGGKVPFDLSRFLLGGNVIPHQAAVFSTTFFRSLSGYDLKFGLTSDQLFMMKASLVSRPHVFTEVLCDFDASGAGSTRGVWAHYKDVRRARAKLNVVVTSSPVIDSVLSTWFALLTKSERVQRRLLRRTVPKVRASSD